MTRSNSGQNPGSLFLGLGIGGLILLLYPAFAAMATPEAKPDRGNVLVEAYPNLDIDSLDPVWANDNLSRTVIFNIYEPLVALKGDSVTELEPRLSEWVPSLENGLISKDGRMYSFPIRKDVRFQNGEKLSCDDARYSMLRFLLLDRPAGGPSYQLLKPVAGALRTRDAGGNVQVDFKNINNRVVCDGGVLRITLPKPYAPFLQVLAQYGLIVSKSWAIRYGDWDGREETWPKFTDPKKENSPFFDQANGTGPYQLETWDKALKSVALKRNPGYWRKPAEFPRVVLKEVPEYSVRRMMIGAGDAQIVDEPSTQYAAQWESLPGVQPVYFSSMRTDSLFFDFAIDSAGNSAIFSGRLDGDGIPPDFFTDRDVRKAFAYSFDYEAFARDVLMGKGVVASGFIPPELAGHNTDGPKYVLDLEKARDHFQKAWKGKAWAQGFKLAVYYNSGNASRQSACEILKKNVESLNPKFKIEVRSLNVASYLAGIRQKKLPLFMIGYGATYADPDCFALAFLHSEGLYMKLQGFKVPEWDGLVEQAAYESDPQARASLYRAMQRKAFEEVPQIYLIHPLTLKIVRDGVTLGPINPLHPGTYFYNVAQSPILTGDLSRSR